MATLALGIAGAGVGSMFGNPMLGFSLGAYAGAFADNMLFGSGQKSVGPRLDSLLVQSSAYGASVPLLYGLMRTGNNLIWSTDLQEHKTTESVSAKGMGGPEVTSYSYSASFAIALCEGPIGGVTQIYFDSAQVYCGEVTTANTITDGIRFTVYVGDEVQTPDPDIEADKGVGNVPGYRGLAYIVFHDVPLGNYGNRIPNVTALVAKAITSTYPTASLTIPVSIWGSDAATLDPSNPFLYVKESAKITKIDLVNNRVLAAVSVPNLYTHPEFVAVERFRVAGAAGGYVETDSPRVYSGVSTRANYAFIARLNPDTLTVEAQSDVDVYTPKRVWLLPTLQATGEVGGYIVTSRLLASVLSIFDYTTLAWIQDINLADYGVLGEVQSGCVDAQGRLWVVSKAHAGSTYTYLARLDPADLSPMVWDISADIVNGDLVCYDDASDTLLIGKGSADYRIIQWDVATETTLANLGANLCSNAKSAFERGPHDGKFYVIHSGTLHEIDCQLGEVSRTWTTASWVVGSIVGNLYEHFAHSVIAFTTTGMERFYLDRTTAVASQGLDEIVADLCERAGLAAAEYDVAALAGDTVPGFVVPTQTTARAALEALQQAYFFDGVESDGVLKFVKRGAGSCATIPEDDMGCYEAGGTPPVALETTRVPESDLPREIVTTYLSPDAEYETAAQRARRLCTGSKDSRNVSLSLALSNDEARQIAEVLLSLAWTARHSHKFTLSRKWAHLEPCDVVMLSMNDGTTHLVRLTSVQHGAPGLLVCEAISDDAAVYVSNAVGVDGPVSTRTVTYQGRTRLVLLDIPLLRDADNDSGLYVVMNGYNSTGWPGAAIYRSADGETWDRILDTTTGAVIGIATTALGNCVDPWIWDEANTVTISLLTDGALSSATEAAVLNGANAAVLGSEIIQWRTATHNADGTYTLSGILRGRRGTEWATGLHVAGELFILADVATWQRIAPPVGLSRIYRAPTYGTQLMASNPLTFSNAAHGLKPYAPCQIVGARNAGLDVVLAWVRRGRISADWRNYVDVPLGEAAEAYEVDWVSEATGLVVRTATGLTTPAATYTRADQTTDGTTGTTVTARIYQVSATVGRGFPGEITGL